MSAAASRLRVQHFFILVAIASGAIFGPANAATGQERLIVTMDDTYHPDNAAQVLNRLNASLDTKIQLVRVMSGRALVLAVERQTNRKKLFKQLRALPGVNDVALDAVVKTTSVDDPEFDRQWQLHSPKRYRASLNLPEAWKITHGSADIVVAVIDTGIDYNHPALEGRILPGYDFVSSIAKSVDKGIVVPDELAYIRSHDGDGRDVDASDPGDSIDEATRQQFDSLDIECYIGNSSWHGTAMASIIAANVDDGIGIAGIDWHAKILPVRAIGKCGGHRSDMLDAIRWAAGVNDPTLPPNPTPARIINLSLGVDDLCTKADQRAINDAIAAGALIVAAVGNNGRNTDAYPSSPSHCQNVIGVMAVDKFGYRADYSNFGRDADIAAPGGDSAPSTSTILVATNKGSDIPAQNFGYRSATGTSVAAPHVAGVLALMLSVKPTLSNRELEMLLLDNSRVFPGSAHALFASEFECNKAHCGAGMLDAYAAVQAVDAHEPGTYLDSPSLAAAQSTPVSVGGYHGLGCAFSDSESEDPILPILGLGSALIMIRRLLFRAARS